METADMQEFGKALAAVEIVRVAAMFTTKHVSKPALKKAMREWSGVGPRDVRNFVWPKVTLRGPGGETVVSMTWWNPNVQADADFEVQRVLLKTAFGKVKRVAGTKKLRVDYYARLLKQEIQSRISSACYQKGLLEKVRQLWRKERRTVVCKSLQEVMTRNVEILSDYDVRETWRTVKRLKKVGEVMSK